MKRRSLLLGGAAVISTPVVSTFDIAYATGAPDPNRLNQDLTPLGGERAASKSGLVPAWTGGVTAPPEGWSPNMPPPDLFGDEAPLFTVTQLNMAQYADMLSDGQMQMLKQKPGYKIVVYPSHRTACAPQYVYDNTFKNVSRAQALPTGQNIPIEGFTGAINGVPFPILSDDPNVAGAQAMWNHQTRWRGEYITLVDTIMIVTSEKRILQDVTKNKYWSPYYDPAMSPDDFDGVYLKVSVVNLAPPNQIGGKFIGTYSIESSRVPDTEYEYLVGQGRIREAPSVEYDTPAVNFGDAINNDENFVFLGAMDRYSWKVVGKKEVIVPYNCNKIYTSPFEELVGLQYLNPDCIRHEVHRCWVIEAHLAPGARMSSPFRRFYLDEDTWAAIMSDSYDDQGNYWKWAWLVKTVYPNLPGTLDFDFVVVNFQEQKYVLNIAFYDAPAPLGSVVSIEPFPKSVVDPQSMANSGGF
jgi:hypothetical protein